MAAAMAVSVEGVTKRFRENVAVDGLDLSIPEGAIFGFIGPNGSGKSTTLRMILRIIEPDEGRILVLGADRRGTANDAIAYLPEERGLYRKLKVGAQLTYFGRLKGMSKRAAETAAREWLDRLGLADRWGDKTETLSKGMTQKVQFIATVLAQPRLLVLDEPFSGLDPVNLEVLRDGILSLRRGGATILFSTHDMPTAEAMCDQICMIYQGRKVLDGTLAAIREQYGQDVIRLRVEEAGEWHPSAVPEVTDVRDLGQSWEVRTSGDGQGVLRAAMAVGTVTRFERAHPSLHDIFIRLARPPETLPEVTDGL